MTSFPSLLSFFPEGIPVSLHTLTVHTACTGTVYALSSAEMRGLYWLRNLNMYREPGGNHPVRTGDYSHSICLPQSSNPGRSSVNEPSAL